MYKARCWINTNDSATSRADMAISPPAMAILPRRAVKPAQATRANHASSRSLKASFSRRCSS